jgi:pimeloyl-ACP methyl ester carboxylesterase
MQRRNLACSWRRPCARSGGRASRAEEIAREEALGLPRQNDNVVPLQRLFSSLDFTSRLPMITCPVLVVYGDRDAMADSAAKLFRDALPNLEVVALAGIGHDPFFEGPDAALGAVHSFLK